jgi:hypothetical protein
LLTSVADKSHLGCIGDMDFTQGFHQSPVYTYGGVCNQGGMLSHLSHPPTPIEVAHNFFFSPPPRLFLSRPVWWWVASMFTSHWVVSVLTNQHTLWWAGQPYTMTGIITTGTVTDLNLQEPTLFPSTDHKSVREVCMDQKRANPTTQADLRHKRTSLRTNQTLGTRR